MLASFEKTADHLFDAAYFGQKDSICGKLTLHVINQNNLCSLRRSLDLNLSLFLFQVCPSASSWGFQ